MENMMSLSRNIDGLRKMGVAFANFEVDGKSVTPYLTAGIEALEKDIPKALIYENLKDGIIVIDIYSCKCPTCNHEWRTMGMLQSRCMECGQKLHWQQTEQREGGDDNES